MGPSEATAATAIRAKQELAPDQSCSGKARNFNPCLPKPGGCCLPNSVLPLALVFIPAGLQLRLEARAPQKLLLFRSSAEQRAGVKCESLGDEWVPAG